MYSINRLSQTPLESPPQADVRRAPLHCLEGTIQRVNYRTRGLTVVAEGQLWRFDVAEDCQLWFDGRLAPLRCFQPLDHIRIFYESRDGRHVAQALYVWEPLPTGRAADTKEAQEHT